MKKTLFVASLLLCSLPAMAESGMTLSGEGIANDCTWNVFATFDAIGTPSATGYTGLATVNFGTDGEDAYYVVGYRKNDNGTITLGMANHANPSTWVDLGSTVNPVSVSATSPLSFALFHNGSNEGGDNSLTLHIASGTGTQDNPIVVNSTQATEAAERHDGLHIASVTLGTAIASTSLSSHGEGSTVSWNMPTSTNLTSARLQHSTYSDTAFKIFIYQQQAWGDEIVRYTTADGNQADVYSYATEDGAVTFNPDKFDKDNKLTLDSDSTTMEVNARTTFIVDDGKTVEISGPSDKNSAGSVTGGGELVKSGGGELMLRLNDVERNVDYNGKNDFYGNVTVEEGTLHLLHTGTNSDKKDLYATIGGGTEDNGSVVTVKEGATLVLDNHTKISIPYGARTSPNTGERYYSVDITGGAVASNGGKLSTIQDAIIDRNGIKLVDPEVRAQLAIEGIAFHDNRPAGLSTVEKADIVTDEFVADGHIVFDDATLDATVVWTTGGYWDTDIEVDKKEEFEEEHHRPTTLHSAKLQNKSRVQYSGEAWGHMDNVYVDKTSSLTTKSTGKTLTSEERADGAALHIQGTCTLEVEDINCAGGGLATRTDEMMKSVYKGEAVTIHSINYTTEQLSGDMLVSYNEYPSTLDIILTDEAGRLPAADTKENLVFTLTLVNFDSSLVVENPETGELNKEIAKLTINAYKGVRDDWHLVYGYYDKEKNNTVFTFSQVDYEQLPLEKAPEPATATLSLLALAALAARRKRK